MSEGRGGASVPGGVERRPRRRLWLLTLAAVALVAAALSTYYSPAFRVQRVEVVAPAGVDAAALATVASLRGESLFTVSLEEAEARLEALPWVKVAEAHSRWPQTVQIFVTLRIPWGYWQMGDVDYVVDGEGVVLSVGGSLGAAPAIRQTDGRAGLSPGDRVDAEAVLTAQRLLEALPQSALGGRVSVVQFEHSLAQGLSLSTDAGYRVVVGDSHGLDYKLAVWQGVEAKLGRRLLEGQTLDLRFGDRPSLRRQ